MFGLRLTKRKGLLIAVLISTMVYAFPAMAGPSVFVRAKGNYAWWYGEVEARILGKAAGEVTVQKITDYIAENQVFFTYDICRIEQASPETYVGLDIKTQEQINTYLPQMEFLIPLTTPDGRKLLAQMVVFESCFAPDIRGAAIVVSDPNSKEIVFWQLMDPIYVSAGKTRPNWVAFMRKPIGDEMFSYSPCAECGEITYIYYDVTRQKVYSEYNGH